LSVILIHFKAMRISISRGVKIQKNKNHP